MSKACGHPDCAVSTGIHEGLTFGRGDLDEWGYWEIPCGPCARAWERAYPEDAPCWPFEGRTCGYCGERFAAEKPAQLGGRDWCGCDPDPPFEGEIVDIEAMNRALANDPEYQAWLAEQDRIDAAIEDWLIERYDDSQIVEYDDKAERSGQ